VVHYIKGLQDIEGDDCRSRWRLSLIEAVDCSGYQRKKSGSGRAKRAETVLRFRKRKGRRIDERKEEAF
jgi:hypothetical protein